MRIKNIGKAQPKVINIGATQPKVDSSLVAKVLGAEYVTSVETNSHNLALPKSLQESLMQATDNKVINSEKESELVLN